jgi:hypothetical protein
MKNLFFLLICAFTLYAQQDESYFNNIILMDDSIAIFSDIMNDKIYSLKGSSLEIIVMKKGCGNNFYIDTEGKIIAFKAINDKGLQAPFIFNYQNREEKQLYRYSELCSQVGIIERDHYYFAVGDTLIIYQNGSYYKYKICGYSNQIVYNKNNNTFYYIKQDNKIYYFDLNNLHNDVLYDLGNENYYFNPVIIGNNLFFQSINNKIFYIDLKNKSLNYFSNGSKLKKIDEMHLLYREFNFDNDSLKSINYYLFSIDEQVKKQIIFSDKGYINDFFIKRDKIYSISKENDKCYFKVQDVNSSNLISKIEMKFTNSIVLEKEKIQSNITATNTVIIENIPYVNQVYDTPDWHWGRTSCAPATAMMVLGYYNVLPEWPYKVSYPSSHISKWGGYIADRYIFNGNYYTQPKDVYNGSTFKNTCYGAFSYMWTNGSPYSKMANYYKNHGLTANQIDIPSYSVLEEDILKGYPVSVCVMLTSSGHLILAKGIQKLGTFIFNDPYGNKNLQSQYGYPNNYGENTPYDWPGYNNGNVNLDIYAGTNAGVAWLIKTRFNKFPKSDTLVDDLQLNSYGFVIKTNIAQNLSQTWDYMVKWYDVATGGYNGHYWWAYTTQNIDLQEATWTPNLPDNGIYEVFVYIPSAATANDANYSINTLNGLINIKVDQKANKNSWFSLGTYNFDKSKAYVKLTTNSSINNQILTFDAVKFSKKNITSISEQNDNQNKLNSISIYPNPFNSSTILQFQSSHHEYNLLIFNILGEKVIERKIDSNENNVILNFSNFTNGVYFLYLYNRNEIFTKKLLYLK